MKTSRSFANTASLKRWQISAGNASRQHWNLQNRFLVQEEVEAGKPCLLVLHGDQQNAAQTAPYWQSAKELGYGLGLAQSSQVQMSEAYLWMMRENRCGGNQRPMERTQRAGRRYRKQYPLRILFWWTSCILCSSKRSNRTKRFDSGFSMAARAGRMD